jgi:hypothetical protein
MPLDFDAIAFILVAGNDKAGIGVLQSPQFPGNTGFEVGFTIVRNKNPIVFRLSTGQNTRQQLRQESLHALLF